MKNTIPIRNLVSAYSQGYFPMADTENGEIYWYNPNPRAIIPLNRVKMQRSTKRSIVKENFYFGINKNFDLVIKKCSIRENCWISPIIIDSYIELNRFGYAHSVETYKENELVGGLYGVSLGGAFFGESMFSTVTNASKAAFYFLVERLKQRGFLLLDTQFICSHTESLGAIEIPRYEYLIMLENAINRDCSFV